MGVDDSDLTTQQNQAYQMVQVQVRQAMSSRSSSFVIDSVNERASE